MSIHPLPVFEADADPHHRDAMTDAEIYASLQVPKSLVVKFGYMKMIAELPYDGDVKPGCGTKLVARTFRGTEIGEMLTTTCENAGCAKSITRKEMLEYIENSGGKDFPFHTEGRVLRVATIDDLNRMGELESRKREWVKFVKAAVRDHELDMKVVEVEPILGEEVLTVFFMAEERVDFRSLVRHLAGHFKTRIEMRQVGARDEARLVADYERCGQHCCCKNFLKVLKPVSMRSAKIQKATLDPLKISGRCGRLMCCLRYEDQTYRQLRKNLPNKKSRVGTIDGPGIVLDTKILAQLVLVKLEHDGREIAVPVEELIDPDACPAPGERASQTQTEFRSDDPLRGLSPEEIAKRAGEDEAKAQGQDRYREWSEEVEDQAAQDRGDKTVEESSPSTMPTDRPDHEKRSRGRRGRGKRRHPQSRGGRPGRGRRSRRGKRGKGRRDDGKSH